MVLAPGNFARALIQNAQRPGLMEMIQGLIADFPTLFEKLLYPADHRFNVMLALCLCGIVYNLVMLFKKRDATAICAASLSVGFLAAISVFLIPEARGGRMLLTKAPLKTLERELVALIDDEKGSQSVEIYIDDTPVTQKTRINAVPTYFTITIPEESQKKLAETGVLTLNFHLPDIDPMPQATPIPGTHPVNVGLRSLRILP